MARGCARDGLPRRAGGRLLLDDLHTWNLLCKSSCFGMDRGTYSPVGSDRVLSVACRVVLAMTDAPDVLMQRGQLLKDLRYRFGACAIGIRAARAQRGDSCVRATRAGAMPGAHGFGGTDAVQRCGIGPAMRGGVLGNVRQLEGIVLCAYLFAREQGLAEIGVQHLPAS